MLTQKPPNMPQTRPNMPLNNTVNIEDTEHCPYILYERLSEPVSTTATSIEYPIVSTGNGCQLGESPSSVSKRLEIPPTSPLADSANTKPIVSPVCRCGGTEYHDFIIHAGRSTGRDCRKCRKFICFPVWWGVDQ